MDMTMSDFADGPELSLPVLNSLDMSFFTVCSREGTTQTWSFLQDTTRIGS